MKFSLASLIALALVSTTVMALQEPAPASAAPTFCCGKRALEKRTELEVKGKVEAKHVDYREYPNVDSPSLGQYDKGETLTLVCYTRENTSVVDGDAGWAKLVNGNYVPLGSGKDVSWEGGLPKC